ncbi:MAG: magnesium transporter [Acidimicrobiia bacterium]
MKFSLRRPRELARQLRLAARRNPDEVSDFLDENYETWAAIAEATPGDAADILEALPDDTAGELFGELDDEQAAGVLEELRDDLAADFILVLDPEAAARVIEEMAVEEAVDILEQLDPEEREPILKASEPLLRSEIRRLLRYAPDSAGGLMTSEIARLPLGITAGEAIERLRQLHDELEDLSYVYIVDDFGRLEGVLSFRDLVFNRPGVGLDEVMVRNPVHVDVNTDREVIADLTQRYHLFGLPVVDEAGRLQGMVTHESVVESVQDEASEDFAAAVGAGVEETPYTEIRTSVRNRMPWLAVNLFLSLGVALVIESQTGVISRVPVLAALMPVIALLGGNGGSQSLAVVIRGLAKDELPRSRSLEVIGRQASIGVFNGLALAALAGGASIILINANIFTTEASAIRVAIVVAIGTLANLSIATTAGTMIPLLMRRIGLDPALAATIFLTLITDLVGFGGFLIVASLLL